MPLKEGMARKKEERAMAKEPAQGNLSPRSNERKAKGRGAQGGGMAKFLLREEHTATFSRISGEGLKSCWGKNRCIWGEILSWREKKISRKGSHCDVKRSLL